MLTSKCTMFAGVLPSLCNTTSRFLPFEMASSCTSVRKWHSRIVPKPIAKQTKQVWFQKVMLQQKRFTATTSGAEDVVKIEYRHGLPVISVLLPSKSEKCSFTLRPLMSTVGQFLDDLKAEDKGIDTAVIHGPDDSRVASSTKIEHLLFGNFTLTINNTTYNVQPPPMDEASMEHVTQFEDIKQVVARLYNNLNIDEYCVQKEQEALGRLEDLKTQLEPLEKVRQEVEAKATFRTNLMIWGGLAFMSAQFGILARLTWWEYSWDIMEPVTYFITYGTAILMYGYFILTKQEYIYPDARDRQFLRFLHKAANKSNFDVSQYNSLCEKIAKAEDDLKKLREPVGFHIPVQPIKSKKEEKL